MNEEVINNLPVDAKKEFIKLGLKLAEKKTKTKVHDDFLSFVKHVWPEFIEGKHHKEIADKFNLIAQGKLKRLIILTIWSKGHELVKQKRHHFSLFKVMFP